MSQETVTLVVALLAFFGVMGSATLSFISAKRSAKNAQSIEQVHLSINSRMDQLLDLTRKNSERVGADKEKLRALDEKG